MSEVSRAQLFASMVGMASGDQSRVVDRSLLAEEEAVKGTCMRDAGFAYVDARPEMLEAFAEQTDVHDPGFAEKYGFGIGLMPATAARNPNDAAFMSLPRATADAWSAQQDTCDDMARRSVDKRLGDLASLRQLSDDAVKWARADPEFIAAQVTWKACMTARGIGFVGSSFWDLFDQFARLESGVSDGTSPHFADERAAAIASAACDGDQWVVYRRAVARAVEKLSPEMYALTAEYR